MSRGAIKSFLLASLWLLGYLALLLGCAAQVALLTPLLTSLPVRGLAAFVLLAPWLILYTLSFFKRPPVSAGWACRLLFLAMLIHVSATVLTETLLNFGFVPDDRPADARTLLRVFLHFGWLGLFPLVALYRSAKQATCKPAGSATSAS
jgi:hypothetical protein